jgi:hypothetical protein
VARERETGIRGAAKDAAADASVAADSKKGAR